VPFGKSLVDKTAFAVAFLLVADAIVGSEILIVGVAV